MSHDVLKHNTNVLLSQKLRALARLAHLFTELCFILCILAFFITQ